MRPKFAPPGCSPWVPIFAISLLSLSVASAASPPAITNQPADLVTFFGDAALFQATAGGSAPLRYQWFRNGASLPGATTNTYRIPTTSSNDAGAAFFLRVTNSAGSVTSRIASLTIDFGRVGPPQTNSLLAFPTSWRYNQTSIDLGTNWVNPGFSDASAPWTNGSGVFDGKNTGPRAEVAGQAVGTDLRLQQSGTNRITYYFRTHFALPFALSNAAQVLLNARYIADDGAAFYLNGASVFSVGITNVSVHAWASRTVTDPTPMETADFAAINLVAGDNLLAVEVHQANATSSDITFGLALDSVTYPRLRDTNAPVLAYLFPEPGSSVASLNHLEVHFDEGVKGVTAGDLLVNGLPAAEVVVYAPDVYDFRFANQPSGTVYFSWSLNHTITDLSANSNRFQGKPFSIEVDPAAVFRSIRLNEFMAGNGGTIMDDLGQYSDWIELYNPGTETVDLGGWYLSDNPQKLRKWQFPEGTRLPANTYLVVWASGQSQTNTGAPLHADFKLEKTQGGFLALTYLDGTNVVSSFPNYPQQDDDVSFGRDALDPSMVGYFRTSTCGTRNAALGESRGPEVRFSRSSGTFQTPFTLTLATGNTNAVIRYLLVTNGATAALTAVPNTNSLLYTGPISIDSSVQVRARAYLTATNSLPGPPVSSTYLKITSGAASFSSSVPLVLLHNFGSGTPPATFDQSAVMMVFGTGSGRASLSKAPDLVTRIGLNIRGRSTQGLPKSSFAVETWDDLNEDQDVEILGMPADSDWVLYAPNYFDTPLIHNPVVHEIGRSLGRYSSRTRMVEVFTSFGTGAINYVGPTLGNYGGVYVLEEKIKAGKGRVDVPRLGPGDTNATSITGGYVMKIDSADPDERTLYAGNQALVFVEPQMKDYAAFPGRAAQEAYIASWIDAFYLSLTGPNWNDPVNGYAAWIDVSSWIDYHLVNTLTRNPDAFRLSAYLFKGRGGKLEMGPSWDFDRAMGASAGSDWRSWNPRSWMAENPMSSPSGTDFGTDFFNPCNVFANPWYELLFQDPDFWQRWIDRYQELREGPLATNAVFSIVDKYSSQVREAQSREVARWAKQGGSDTQPRSGWVGPGVDWPDPSFSYYFPGTFQGEIDFLKTWLAQRLDFMDTNFLNRPAFSARGGAVSPGFTVNIAGTDSEPGTIIYYTLDGSDPRLPGGGVSPSARAGGSSVQVIVTNNIRLCARSLNGNHHNLTGPRNPPLSSAWSGMRRETFYTGIPPLVVTEIMYHPAPDPGGTNSSQDFEFIELMNRGANSVNLAGASVSRGIQFSFSTNSPIQILRPGEFLVLVRNQAAFLTRYPLVTNIAGECEGSLDNGGERLELRGALDEPILDFAYDASWYPTSDGVGFSLVIGDESAPLSTWTNASSWRPSSATGGSPGRRDPAPASLPRVVINEVLTHTDFPQLDSVELYNPGPNPAFVGGWFLSDDPEEPKKFRLPGATIPAGEYLLYTEADFNTGSNGFAFSSLGDRACLFSGDGTNLTGYGHSVAFGAQVNGRTFGRTVTSDGREHFVTEETPSLGGPNRGPKVGPVLVSEVMYQPPSMGLDPDTLDEFIELRNASDSPVPLYDPQHATNSWRLTGGVGFLFPSGLVLAPWSWLLVVSFDPLTDPVALQSFRTRYGLDASTPICGPYLGRLSNEGEGLKLLMPDKPEIPPSPNAGFVPYVLVEAIDYMPAAPWPTEAAGTGSSLQRLASLGFGNEPANWMAGPPTPGKGFPAAAAVDSDGDGQPDEAEFLAGTNPKDPADFLKFESVSCEGAYCHLKFFGRAGRIYSVQRTADLASLSPVWTLVAGNLQATNAPVDVFETLTESAAFYRLSANRAP
jgi:hypothetical protein